MFYSSILHLNTESHVTCICNELNQWPSYLICHNVLNQWPSYLICHSVLNQWQAVLDGSPCTKSMTILFDLSQCTESMTGCTWWITMYWIYNSFSLIHRHELKQWQPVFDSSLLNHWQPVFAMNSWCHCVYKALSSHKDLHSMNWPVKNVTLY